MRTTLHCALAVEQQWSIPWRTIGDQLSRSPIQIGPCSGETIVVSISPPTTLARASPHTHIMPREVPMDENYDLFRMVLHASGQSFFDSNIAFNYRDGIGASLGHSFGLWIVARGYNLKVGASNTFNHLCASLVNRICSDRSHCVASGIYAKHDCGRNVCTAQMIVKEEQPVQHG